jgi:hypothetical protein
MLLSNPTNTTVLYDRLTVPGATGATVTSWGWGGHDTLEFLEGQWLGSGMTQQGRIAWLQAIVEGGSGDLNVVINEGFNDRNDAQMSYNDVAPSNTLAGFADNMDSLIAAVRTDWITAGFNLSNLSFTIMSDYKDDSESSVPAGTGPLAGFAQVEEQIADADSQISYVDLYDRSLPYDTANADGLMFDGVHASLAGTNLYAMDALQALLGNAPKMLGDTNGDGIVNDADLAIVLTNMSQRVVGGYADGDFNNDGVVNDDDFTLFELGLAEYNQSAGNALPEPVNVSLAGIAAIALNLRRRRSTTSKH